MGSACDVHNVLLDSDKIIQISNFNLVCGVHEVTYEEIDIYNVLDSRLAASGQFSNLNLICYIQIFQFEFSHVISFYF